MLNVQFFYITPVHAVFVAPCNGHPSYMDGICYFDIMTCIHVLASLQFYCIFANKIENFIPYLILFSSHLRAVAI